ncbi:beta strand repeat-containing protein, partial [Gluconacetobacter johannae]|uniref:beta strand repeat-containing protein n=1 Tax=Gluconacetobacter johannae TaxID=112140 RepID=UPI002231DA74
MKKKLNKKTRTLMKLKKISKSTNNINGANDKNEKYFVPLTKYQPAMARAFRLALVTSPFATLSPAAFAQTLPSDYLFAITDGSAPNTVSYTTAGNYQTYTTSFTAQETGTNYVLFAFRNDPDYWTFGDVSLTAQGSSTNLLNNPYFLSGGAISDLNNLQAPAEWGVVYQNGTVPNAAGEWNAPTSSAGPSTPSIENSTAGSWYDGAVGSFDGIYQGINLVAGDSYTLSFTASSGEAADSSSVQLGVYTGSCVSLTSGTSCVPDNSGFAVSATPAEAANAGSPGVAMTTRQNAAGLASTPASILPVFDGGTLVLDGTPLTPYTFSITGNNGSIDLAGQSATISNPISDALVGTPGGLTITNSGSGGALTLSGANSYTGGTTIASGAGLNLSGSVAGAVANAGTLTLDGGAVGGTVTNNGALSVTANGGSVGSLTGSGAGTLNGNLTLTNAADTYAGALSGTGGLTLSGGSETLTGTNTYTGGTTINAGTLTGTTASFGSGAITNNGTLDISQNTDGILLNAVSGSGALVKDGSGTVTLAGPMSYTGGTVVNSGTLAMSGFPNVLSPGSMTVNGTLDVSGVLGGMPVTSLSGSGVVALGSRNLTLSHASGTFSGTITDGGIAGGTGGSLTLSDGTETLTGTNTYTGATAINGGTLALSGSGSIAASTGLLVSPVGTFDISGTTNGASVSGLTSFGTTALGGKTLTLTGMGTGTAGPPFSGPAMTLAGGVTATPQNMLIGAITDGGIAGGTGGGLTLASGSATGTVATILSTTGTYTGLTTIGSGTALIAGQGLGGSPISFASSSGVVDHGIFDISI